MRLAACTIRMSQPLRLTGVNNGAAESVELTPSISASTSAGTCSGASKLIFVNDNRNCAKTRSRAPDTVKTPFSPLILQPALPRACSHAGDIAITITYVGALGSPSRECFTQEGMVTP